MALSLCAAPVCAQEWQLKPARLALSAPEADRPAGVFDGLGQAGGASLGPLEFRRGGGLCIDIPGGRNGCELNLRDGGLMLIDREARGRIRVGFQFGIRP